MRIGVISNVSGYPWAGSEELWLATALRALEQGYNVCACLHSDLHAGGPLDRFRALGGRVTGWQSLRIARFERFKERIRPSFTDKGLGMPQVLLVSAGSLPALNYVPGLVSYLQQTNVPIVILCQFNAECLSISPSERESLRVILQRASGTVFVSHQNHQLAQRQFALELRNSQIIYNPIRTVLNVPLPFPDGRQNAVFASVARFETLWKGQDLLLEVVSSACWRRRPWSLRFYGDGPDIAHVKRLTDLWNLGGQISFEGYVRDIESVWKACQMMVLPSRGEGTPLALLEAMMCGRPIVTTDVGGNSEVVEDGITGFIADAATPKSFGNAMERAWHARDRWREMGVAAHFRARELAKVDPSGCLLKFLEQIVNE